MSRQLVNLDEYLNVFSSVIRYDGEINMRKVIDLCA